MTARSLTHPRRLQRLCPWTVAGAATLAATLAAVCAGCTPEPAPAQPSEQAVVVAVVDGDTFKITTISGTVRVRIIGIDTPEIGRNGKTTECYAEQARDELDQLIYGHTVELFTDPTQTETDKYGRLLRHVYVDGVNIALTELEAGAGREYTNNMPYAGQDEYRASERTATATKRGKWGTCPTGSPAF